MRVETDIRAGNMVNDVVDQAGKLGGQVSDFVTSANQQAEGLTTTVVSKSTQLWNAISGVFS